MVKKLLGAFGIIALCITSTLAQENIAKDLDLDFYGFVRNDFYIDTYKGIDAAHEQFYLIPNYGGVDANGEDLNQQASANLSSITTRLGVKVDGPEIFRAKTNAVIEFDFGGILKTEPTLFRIRQAYTAFTWKKTKLTVGQTWHPFWGGSIYPTVASLNTGSPFQAFSRAPQMRFDVISGKFTVSGTMAYELQYTSRAAESSTYTSPNQAKRNGVLPELIASIEFKSEKLTIGASGLYNRIKPRMTTTGTSGIFKADEFLWSKGATAYIKYVNNKFSAIAKGYYGQNLTQLTMLGGYGVTSIDAQTGKEKYTCYSNYTALVNAVYGKKWQVGILMGIGDNLGTNEALYIDGSGKAKTYGLFQNVGQIYRVAPSLAFNVSKIKLMAEYERTGADFGTGDINSEDGLYSDYHNAANNRFVLTMTYQF